ncbi:MAG: LysM peptidoglycan-binding domain-containing M23 family metallopeptidase [Chloroflexi bacterium]|nr:MAG: LysM peptidoglycan-binding domain-containing M23 family metallopeptidase [Chloroflexota bacterium]
MLAARTRHLSFVALEESSSYLASMVGVRGLRLALNTSVAVLVLSLPFAATAASRANTLAPTVAATNATTSDASRAQPVARGGSIASSRNPMTVSAEGTRPTQEVTIHDGDTLATMANYYDVSVEAIAYANGLSDARALQMGQKLVIPPAEGALPTQEVTIHDGDTLATMANYYDVSVEAIAYANGLSDARALRMGQKLVIPPAEGALYTVKDGDTIDSIAGNFRVDPTVILTFNRCYFEPERCAAGQKIFVRGAELPALLEPDRPARDVFAAAPQVAQQPRNGRLSWPVGGVITQLFWWGHTGVDVAAPYGTGLGAGDDGVVTATGWVAVGGLRVCVQHAGDLTVCYYHTSAVYVSVGQQVARGQIIAAIGLTGVTTGPHVHWECKLGGQFVSCLSL